MYESFYNFKELPFAVPPDPEYLFLSSKHKKALANLEYSILNKAAFSVITGEVGSGKTTLVRELMRKLGDDVVVGLVSNVNISTFEELLQWILYAYELEYRDRDKVELFDIFTEFVIDTYAENKRTVLIIDEAQNLSADILEHLRMLSNINAGKHKVFQLILVGQPNLWDVLRKPEMLQFVQRIEVDYFLSALNLKETSQYIQHRLRVAGGDGELFAPETYEPIWKCTKGVPRLINILCGMALVYAFADQKKKIDLEIVGLVIKEKKCGQPRSEETKATVSTYNNFDTRGGVVASPQILQENRQEPARQRQASHKQVRQKQVQQRKPVSKTKKMSSIEKLFKNGK